MYKFFISCFLLFSSSALFAEYFSIEGNTSYFYPESHAIRRVYSDALFNPQIRMTGHFTDSMLGQCIGVEAAVNYIQKHGRSISLNAKTKLIIVPTSLGVVFSLPIEKLTPYFGSGFRYYYAKEDYAGSKLVDYNGLGGYFELGTRLNITKHVYVNLLADYGIKKFDKKSTSFPTVSSGLKVSGFSIGGGLGVAF